MLWFVHCEGLTLVSVDHRRMSSGGIRRSCQTDIRTTILTRRSSGICSPRTPSSITWFNTLFQSPPLRTGSLQSQDSA